jgi:hypothetical protein
MGSAGADAERFERLVTDQVDSDLANLLHVRRHSPPDAHVRDAEDARGPFEGFV